MKRSSSKELNIITIVIVLTMAFLSIFSIVYAYFTSVDTINGSSTFGTIAVNFKYKIGTASPVKIGDTLIVNPKGTVSRGTPFALTYGGSDVAMVSIGPDATESSCSVYLRFWIDAYLTEELDGNGVPLSTATNYGKYVQFYKNGSKNSYLKSENFGDGSNIIYFYPEVLSNTQEYDLFDSLALSGDLDESALGGTLRITVHFDAIQSTNKAFLSWDKRIDNKGYYEYWE